VTVEIALGKKFIKQLLILRIMVEWKTLFNQVVVDETEKGRLIAEDYFSSQLLDPIVMFFQKAPNSRAGKYLSEVEFS